MVQVFLEYGGFGLEVGSNLQLRFEVAVDTKAKMRHVRDPNHTPHKGVSLFPAASAPLPRGLGTELPGAVCVVLRLRSLYDLGSRLKFAVLLCWVNLGRNWQIQLTHRSRRAHLEARAGLDVVAPAEQDDTQAGGCSGHSRGTLEVQSQGIELFPFLPFIVWHKSIGPFEEA